MFGDKIRKPKLLEGILAVIVAALFVVSFANSANAQLMSFDGTVIAVDRSASTVTLQSGDTEHTFKLSENASVTVCNEPQTIYNIRVGDKLTVWYHTTGSDKFVADSISYVLPAPEMC